jgi:hypothetical protein
VNGEVGGHPPQTKIRVHHQFLDGGIECGGDVMDQDLDGLHPQSGVIVLEQPGHIRRGRRIPRPIQRPEGHAGHEGNGITEKNADLVARQTSQLLRRHRRPQAANSPFGILGVVEIRIEQVGIEVCCGPR